MAFSLREKPWEISEIYSDDRTQCDGEKNTIVLFLFLESLSPAKENPTD